MALHEGADPDDVAESCSWSKARSRRFSATIEPRIGWSRIARCCSSTYLASSRRRVCVASASLGRLSRHYCTCRHGFAIPAPVAACHASFEAWMLGRLVNLAAVNAMKCGVRNDPPVG
jgi:hypothetical protein